MHFLFGRFAITREIPVFEALIYGAFRVCMPRLTWLVARQAIGQCRSSASTNGHSLLDLNPLATDLKFAMS